MDATGLEGAKRTLFIALAVDMAVTFALVIFYYWAVGILEGVRAGTAEASPSTVATFDFWQKFASLTFLTVVGVGVALVRWLGTAYQYARETLGATGFAQEKWKVWGWIVPFLNTFKPFQVLSEIYKAGTSASVGDDWKKSSGSGWLLMWWVFWVLAHIVLVQIFIGAPKSGQSELDLSQSIAALNGGVLACVISLIVSGLWYIVAGSLSSRLLNRSVEFSGAATASADVDFVDTKPNGSIPVMATRTAVDEDAVYAQIAQELETDTVDKGLWTRLVAEADGDEKRTKVLYIKQRAERLLAITSAAAPKSKSATVVNEESVLLVPNPKASPVNVSSMAKLKHQWLALDPFIRAALLVIGAIALFALVSPGFRNGLLGQPAENGAYGKNDTVAPGQFDSSTAKPAADPNAPGGDPLGLYQRPQAEPVTAPNWDKGTITPPVTTTNPFSDPNFGKAKPTNVLEQSQSTAKASSTWEAKALDLMARVKRGEVPTIEGTTSRASPVYGDEWTMTDTLALEKSQTWWIQDKPTVGSIFIHLQNQTAMDLSGAALEYQGRPCNERAAVNNFYLTLTKPIPPGAQAVVNLKTDFPIETKGTTCLVIKRAWK